MKVKTEKYASDGGNFKYTICIPTKCTINLAKQRCFRIAVFKYRANLKETSDKEERCKNRAIKIHSFFFLPCVCPHLFFI